MFTSNKQFMIKVLILGSSGFLGKHLYNENSVISPNFSYNKEDYQGVKYVKNIRNDELKLRKLIAKKKSNIIPIKFFKSRRHPYYLGTCKGHHQNQKTYFLSDRSR